MGYKQHYSETQIELVEALAIAYVEYKEELKGTRDVEFFGLRDFYGLIKKASFLLLKGSATDSEEMFQIVKYSIERNFGGKSDAASRILKIIVSHKPEFERFSYLHPTPTLTLINDNLKDDQARFLMLICKGNVTACAIEQYLELPQMDRRTLVGSHMLDDENREDYGFHSLSDIILYMDKGISIILKDMNHVHTPLYDLFNQNFAISGDRRYCRVALGAQFNPRCFVHRDFRVIVLLRDDDDVLEQTDSPFLNRFEKHRFDIDHIFKQRQSEHYKQISDWTESLLTLANGKKPQISLSHVFPLYSPEFLKLLVLRHDSKEDTLEQCKLELLRMASQEVMLLAQAGDMELKQKTFIQESWNSFHSESFLSYLSTFALDIHPGINKSLIFLYNTDILQSNSFLQLPEHTDYQHFSSFHREEDFEESLINFYRGSNILYLLDFNLLKNGTHLEMVKFVIEKISKEMRNTMKKVCLLVRLKRNSPVKIEICWFDQWDVRTYTSCIEPDAVFFSNEVLTQSVGSVMMQKSFYDFTSGIEKLTLDAYLTFAFKVENSEEINNYIFSITDQLGHCPRLIDAFGTKLLSLLPKKMWVEEVLCPPECVTLSFNIPSAIRVIIELELAAVYRKVLFAAEKFTAFGSFFVESQEKEFLQTLWLDVFQGLKCDEHLQPLKQSNILKFNLPLSFPFVMKDYEILNNIIEECQLLAAAQAKCKFFTQFENRSILKNCFEYASQSLMVQDMYFHDLILIDLMGKKKKVDAREKELLMLLHKCWNCGCHAFKSKVWIYCQQRRFSLTLVSLAAVLRDLLPEEVELIYTVLREFSNKYSQVEECEEERKVESDVKTMLKTAFKQIIERITTSTGWLQAERSLQKTAMLLNQLFNLINCLDSAYDFFIDGYDEIDILALCFQALSHSPSAHSGFLKLQQSAAAVTTGSFLYNENFSHQLFTIIKANCQEEEATRVLSVYLYKLLLFDSNRYLPLVVGHISNTEWRLWKHSSLLVTEVARFAGLINDDMDIIVDINRSKFVSKLEQLLIEGSMTFSVLLCDSIYRHMRIILSFDSAMDAAKIVSKYYERFKKFYSMVTNSHADNSSVIKIYSNAFLRRYLEAYSKAMHNKNSLPLNPFMGKVAADLEFFPAARAYVLKYWKQSENLSLQTIQHEISTRSDIQWTRHFQFCQHTGAIPCIQTPFYNRMNHWITAMIVGEVNHNLSDIINEAISINDLIAFATALMMRSYLSLAKGEKNDTLIRKLKESTDMMNRKFGSAMSELILCLVDNFPEGSCLRLTVTTNEDDKNRALSLCFALIILLSNAKTSSPLTSLFLNKDGNVRSDIIAVSNRSYVCGVGSHPLYSYLQYLIDNFEICKYSMFNSRFSKGSANKCSCGYVYFINNCGGPMEIKNCPFCAQNIGGENHKLVQRPGHENMTDQEAIQFMSQKQMQYKREPESGYWAFDGGESTALQLREITPVAHGTMHLLIALLLRFLNLSNLIPDRDLQVLVKSPIPLQSASIHLEEQLSKDFSNIKRLLNTEDSHFWWYAVLKQLTEFMQSHTDLPTDLRSRTLVESEWNIVMQQFCQRPSNTVQYEKRLASSSVVLSENLLAPNVLSVLNESDPQTFPLLHFYRLIQDPDVISLEKLMELQQLREKYPLLHLYLHLREDIAKLSLLSPLIKLTNYLKNCFNHKIKREDARKKSMKGVFRNYSEAESLFNDRQGVWSWLSTCSLSYECHQLPAKDFTSEEELLNFLIDTQENGTYMTAALLTLADIQNKVMNAYLAVMEKKMNLERSQIIDTRLIPIQELDPENIVQISFTFENSFVNNPEFGKGREIVYNFLRIEEQIQNYLEKGRLVCNTLELICYTYELLSISSQQSDLITRIRGMIHQRSFSQDQVAGVKRFLEYDQTEEQLTVYYQSLNTILYFLQNKKVKAETTLMQFARTMHMRSVCDAFTESTDLSLIQVGQIVALYELLECLLFPYSKNLVKDEFTAETSEVELFLASLDFSSSLPIGELQLVIMRLILRLLIADIDPQHEIGLYITRPDLRAEDCTEQQVDIFKNVTLAHTMQVYNFLEKRVKESYSVHASLQSSSYANPSPAERPRNRGR